MNTLKLSRRLLITIFSYMIVLANSSAQWDYANIKDGYNTKSHDSEGLCKYLDFTTDNSIRAITVSVPICTKRVIGFKLQVPLDYQADGIKVDQISSYAGLVYVYRSRHLRQFYFLSVQ